MCFIALRFLTRRSSSSSLLLSLSLELSLSPDELSEEEDPLSLLLLLPLLSDELALSLSLSLLPLLLSLPLLLVSLSLSLSLDDDTDALFTASFFLFLFFGLICTTAGNLFLLPYPLARLMLMSELGFVRDGDLFLLDANNLDFLDAFIFKDMRNGFFLPFANVFAVEGFAFPGEADDFDFDFALDAEVAVLAADGDLDVDLDFTGDFCLSLADDVCLVGVVSFFSRFFIEAFRRDNLTFSAMFPPTINAESHAGVDSA